MQQQQKLHASSPRVLGPVVGPTLWSRGTPCDLDVGRRTSLCTSEARELVRRPGARTSDQHRPPHDNRFDEEEPYVATITRPDGASRAGLREWLGLAVLALPTLLVALDINSVFLALPHLSIDLHASATQQLWVADGYGLMVAGFVVTMGTLGDRIGRRRLLMIGGAAFGLLSLVSAYAVNPLMLIVARLLLGVAGATLMPSTLALISTIFTDARQRTLAITTWSTCVFAGAALGPVLGGVLLTHYWWGSVLLIGVPTMAALLVAAPLTLPESRNPDAGRLDLTSVMLSLAGILPLTYGVKQLGADRADAPLALGAAAIGALFAVLFVRRQRGLPDPLLRLDLLRDRIVGGVLAALVVTGAGLAGVGLLTTQYLQIVCGLSPLASAVWFAPMGLALAAGCTLAPLTQRWMSPGAAIVAGLAVSTLGFLPVALASGPVTVIVGTAVIALGTGPLFALGTGMVIGSVPPERAGSAAALSETSNYLGGTAGIALFGTVAAGVYHARLAGFGGAPAAARESVAGATSVAATLPAGPADRLLEAAHTAFTSSLSLVAACGAVLFLALTILAARRFR
ncbi:MFS transporter [Micromonospora sp. NPDC047548]|uniref:MFS transporter n=1 Tax=Micromonospora sp. NPDC047548 TaxID=3155624 RepID=UPI00340AAE40